MSFLLDADNLKLHRLAGGDITSYPPLFAPTGDSLFLISESVIHVYSTTTGFHIRELEGADRRLIGMELELNNDDILIGCTETGEMIHWKWSTGQIKRRKKLKLPPDAKVTSFNQLDWYGDSETANVLVLYVNATERVQWQIYETTNCEYVPVPCSLFLHKTPAIAAIASKSFKIICIAQSFRIYFIDYVTWKWIGLNNGLKVPITCLKWHPAEEMIATGDENGRILLWREFWDKTTVKNRLYHWHPTPVMSIAFTQSGSGFYSSGMEAVVVIWNVSRPELRKFVPRISCVVRHIAVSKANVQVALSTLDNGVQILGNDQSVKCNLQEFTFSMADKTGKSRFPVGLRMNPRSNALVLNGRVGHLQFYSAYTRSLLYNMDIVNQNQLSLEMGKILYNINVTKAAFNIDWMATGEVFNDEEHFPELRLKFWKYLEQSQSYSLNTSIELPHECSFKAIEFSSANQAENLLCATVGGDNIIKIWSLQESDNIYKKGKVWFCIAEANYKNLPIESVSFSQDGSLLAAGCGNTLCIFKAESLKLKAALNTSPGVDGSISKAEIRLAAEKGRFGNEGLSRDRDNILQQFSKLLDHTNDDELIKKLKTPKTPKKSMDFKLQGKAHKIQLDKIEKSAIYHRIMNTHQLNLFQQVMLLQRLGIQCEVESSWHDKMISYLKETIYKTNLTQRVNDLKTCVHRLNVRHRFKAKYRMQQFLKRTPKEAISGVPNANLVSIFKILGLKDISSTNTGNTYIYDDENQKMDVDDVNSEERREQKASNEQETTENILNLNTMANVRHVQFAANEYGHLVIVCTESRVLIWNLLTLRLENILKLSTKHLAFDPLTNLAAIFTRNNELHIFQPNVPMPVYQRGDLPNVLSATWLPCRYPKRSSIHVDWQSQSRLYFFTDSQEILYLHDPNSRDLVDLPSTVSFKNPTEVLGLQYSTFGTFAIQKTSDISHNKRQSGPLIIGNNGKSAVKVLVDMSTHTMPPLSLVSTDFLKSLIKPAESAATFNSSSNAANDSRTKKILNGNINGKMNGDCRHDASTDDDDDDDDEQQDSIEVDDDDDVRMMNGIGNKTKTFASKMSVEAYRKNIAAKSEEIKIMHEKTKLKEQSAKHTVDTQLNRLYTLNLDLGS